MSTATTPVRPERLVFIDVLRLIAAVQMIQGHSIDAVLAPAHRQGSVYLGWSFLRGLTSVTFLVTAGLAFVLAEAVGGTAGRVRRARRALFLIAVGYLMHAPLGWFLGSPAAEVLRGALVVDVLQCIGVSLLALELLSLATAQRALRAGVALALALGCFVAAPVCGALSFQGAARVLGNYVTASDGSVFPLIPWAGYVLAGFGVGTLTLRAPRGGLWLAAAGLACGLLGWLGMPHVAQPRALSPPYCLLKLGCVLLFAGLAMLALRGVRRLPRLLARLASSTLFLYVSHVVVLYADHVGLAHRLGTGHGPSFGIALALVLLVGCSAGALATPALRESLRGRARSGTRGASP